MDAFDEQLIFSLKEKFSTEDFDVLMNKMGDEIINRFESFDYLGHYLYNIYVQILIMNREYFADAQSKNDFDVLGDEFLAHVENELRKNNAHLVESGISMANSFIPFEDDVGFVLTEIDLEILDKNFRIMRKILSSIDDDNVLADKKYKLAFDLLDGEKTIPNCIYAFGHLLYLINVYGIKIDHTDAYELSKGNDDLKLLHGLSDESLNFINGLG